VRPIGVPGVGVVELPVVMVGGCGGVVEMLVVLVAWFGVVCTCCCFNCDISNA
jgi:hypothetical protein